DRERDAPEAITALGALAAQCLEPPHAALVAGAPRLDALADPGLLLRQHLVELRVEHRLAGELVGLARLVLREAARVRPQAAAIELDDAGRDAIEEAPVVGDDHDRAAQAAQQLLEP